MSFSLPIRGPFSLAAAARFVEGFPASDAQRRGGDLRFSWAVDGDWRTVTATLIQRGETLQADLDGNPPALLARRARNDVEGILSLDVDGEGFAALAAQDPVIAALQRRFAGLRPVLLYTPYEAAAWTIIGQRIRIIQAAAIKHRLANELGEHGAFPAPARLAQLGPPQPGLSERKISQLRDLAHAALAGALDREDLRAMRIADATEELQRLPGIGPFAAELILVRGVGSPDLLPRHDHRLARAAHAAYGLTDEADIEPIAERWRPYRAWVALLLRAWLEGETAAIARGRPTNVVPNFTRNRADVVG